MYELHNPYHGYDQQRIEQSYEEYCIQRFVQKLSNGLRAHYDNLTTQGSPGPRFYSVNTSNIIVYSHWKENPSHTTWMLSAHGSEDSAWHKQLVGVYKLDVFCDATSNEATATGLIVCKFGGQGIGSHLLKASKWALQVCANEYQMPLFRAIVDARERSRTVDLYRYPHLVSHFIQEDGRWSRLLGEHPNNPKVFYPHHLSSSPSDCPFNHPYTYDTTPESVYLP